MIAENQLNNFSMIARLFGNLWYRSPTDPILADVFAWLQQNGLSELWPLTTDLASEQALASIQRRVDLTALDNEYQRLFVNENALVNTKISAYQLDVVEFINFRQMRGMHDVQNEDHFALLLLTASWIEDNVDSVVAQRELFEQFLLPCASKFLPQVEAKANLPFYKALAILCKDILAAMADELDEAL